MPKAIKTTTEYRGHTIITSSSPVTRQTRHSVWGPNGVNLKSFFTLDGAKRFIDERQA